MTTRDEAIRQAEKALGMMLDSGVQSIEARKFVDMAVALGILKLDEPRRSAEDRLCSQLCIQGFNPTARVSVYSAIDRAGLKIVEK